MTSESDINYISIGSHQDGVLSMNVIKEIIPLSKEVPCPDEDLPGRLLLADS